MTGITIRAMTADDRLRVAEMICESTNHWYVSHGHGEIFGGGPETTAVFFDVYEALDPGCGLLAVDDATGLPAGSCFYHPRETHISLGIMNVHPDHAGRGVARALLEWIVDFAHGEGEGRPVRLVSSAMNLDSYSLYTRAGFTPRTFYQDMILPVPAGGLDLAVDGLDRVRPAEAGDVPVMGELEMAVAGIRREKDYRYFIANADGAWHVSIYAGSAGGIEGFCASSAHPGCNMIGPCVATGPAQAAALLAAELDRHRGRSPVFVVPADCAELVATLYARGARNCELHVSQVLGDWRPPHGVTMPTFLPETC